MSKADQLGAGRFGTGVRPVSARRHAVAAATGVPTEGVAPPSELPVHRVSLNPDNPRSKLGDLTDLAGSLKTHGQKQAITVMNRDAYVKANPGREADLEPDTTHVVVDGSTRLAAAREAGIATVKVMVSDDQGTTSEELLESALVANIHRQDLEELDEARALQRLLAIHGSQTALAKRLHRSQGWVSQRLALLNLTPELQARVGEEPIDLLRAVGNKPADQQAAALEELKAERARKDKKTRREPEPQEVQQGTDTPADGAEARPVGDYAVITEAAAQRGEADTQRSTVEAEEPSSSPPPSSSSSSSTSTSTSSSSSARRQASPTAPPTASETIPEPRADSPTSGTSEAPQSEESRVRKVPYDQPGALAMLLDVKVSSDDLFFDLLRFLSVKGLERDPARLRELAQSFVEQAATRAG
ncbi:plasmid partitioning protein [Streptomyces hygroscopicus]|uniref:ParB/RepB/Spo0J family partition protein n=1 Tax=Streptomyces hygroscopicus TaxID=1912 RepID=UPI00223F2772|nr:ParB/RepB/Spo0J family partition protein [Streptomyces hygroscopicus]MCW7946969.1 plasmid partitioning protein [Streptomyces hygroscopicus]